MLQSVKSQTIRVMEYRVIKILFFDRVEEECIYTECGTRKILIGIFSIFNTLICNKNIDISELAIKHCL